MIRASRLPVLMIILLPFLIFSCALDDTDEDSDSNQRQNLVENFESVTSIENHNGFFTGQTADAFVDGLEGNGYWMGSGNRIAYTAQSFINPEQGAIEFWICVKNRWNDGKLYNLLSVGSLRGFSISKDTDDDIRLMLHGKGIGFMKDTPFVGEVYEYQWRAGWNHIAVTWRNLGFGDKGELVLIINGEVRNQMVGKLPRIDVFDPLYIGEMETGNAPNAIIDNLKIYNRHKPYWEFLDVTKPYETAPKYPINLYPTPKPIGLLPGDGFWISETTKLIVGESVSESMGFALDNFNDAIEETYGFRLEVTTDSKFSGETDFIVVGTLENNKFLSSVNDQYKIPANQENPGADGYVLEVIPNSGIAVAGADYAGSIKGLLMLRQLVPQHESGYYPRYLLVDFPDFPFRGTVVKGGDLLTNEMKLRLLYFKALGLSHVVFETDAYFDLDDPLISARVKDCFDFARDVGLEPIPLIHSLSDAKKLIEKCAGDGIDCSEGGFENTYCPNEPHVYVILTTVINQVITLVHPNYIHIGHDDVRVFNQDDRCIEAELSPAELYVNDIERIKQIIFVRNTGIKLLAWWDMINPYHYGFKLDEKAPGEDAPDPPDIVQIAPRDLIWCPYMDASLDPLLEFIYPMLTMWGLEEGQWGDYVAGPTRDDSGGAYAWIRHGKDMGIIGFLNRPMADKTLDADCWLSLPAAAEYSWSYYEPFYPENVWYDYSFLNTSYGGL